MGLLENILKPLGYVYQSPDSIKGKRSVSKTLEQKKKGRSYQPKQNFRAMQSMDVWEHYLNQAEMLPYFDRYDLLVMYKQAMRDNHLKSQVRTANMKVLEQPFVIIDQTGAMNEELTRQLERTWFFKACEEILLTEFWGHTLLEDVPNDDLSAPKMLKLIDRMHVNPRLGKVLFTPGSGFEGIKYREKPWKDSLLEFGYPDDLGLLQDLVPETIWKRYSRSDWSRHSEQFGMPWVFGMLDGYEDGDNQAFVNKISSTGANKVVALDKDDKVEMLIDSRNNPHEMYDRMRVSCNEEMSKGVNGQTETADSSKTSGYAQSQTHLDLLNTYTLSRMRKLKGNLNEIVLPFLIERYPAFKAFEGAQFEYLAILESEMRARNPQPQDKNESKKAGDTELGFSW